VKLSIKGRSKPTTPLQTAETMTPDDAAHAATRQATSNADRSARAAAKAIKIDRENMIPKLINSNGSAPKTAATRDLLKDMHLKREAPLRLPTPQGPQIKLSTEDVFQQNRTEAGSKNATIGTYGDCLEAFCHDRDLVKETTLLWELSRTQAMAGSGMAPESVYYLRVAGGLAALNKLPEPEQVMREAAGEQRKVRPVNSGPALTKPPMRLLLKHPSAKRVAKNTIPIQMGYGAKSGPQAKVTIARALTDRGHFASLQDAKNAFNAISRQAIIDTVAFVWPEAMTVMNCFYGIDAPCFYNYEDEDGNYHMDVIISEEGVRMGCVIGGFCFNATMHDRVYSKLAIQFPEFVLRALTDDLTEFGQPDDPDDYDQWQAIYA
jgi:hypothetical protein